jgi:hypothetical protein
MRAALSPLHRDAVASQFRFVVVVMPIREGSMQGEKETQEAPFFKVEAFVMKRRSSETAVAIFSTSWALRPAM